jgi:hypothetical protein
MTSPPETPMFREPPTERSFPTAAVAIAAVAVVILVAVFGLLGHRHGHAEALSAAYAPQLAISNVHLSQSNSTLAGGTVTYVEGHVQNNGPDEVTAANVQVVFSNDVGMPPETDTRELRLVRIRVPEIDTEPISDAPILPGKGADFWLIFESVNSNWNEQAPAVRVIGVQTK